MNKIKSFLKSQAVLTAAWILAIISSFIVKPSRDYFGYIDWRSLSILWSLMVIMMAFRLNGVFEETARLLLSKVQNMTSLIAVLVFLCFFLSMFVTNDVSLITFVPFSILILKACGQEKLLIPVIVLQTIAANLGSMLTPIGNPQNLYLYNLCGMSLPEFLCLMLPFTAGSFVLLVICVFWLGKQVSSAELKSASESFSTSEKIQPNYIVIVLSTILFVMAIFTVLHVLKSSILVACVFVSYMIFERKAIKKADYFLLLTFVGFFIFTGNLSKIGFIYDKLTALVSGHELAFGVITSQFISNVPAALLLSDFSTHLDRLIEGVNLGGLGTLIASMASLISFKFYSALPEAKNGKYLFTFTALNVLFLAILLVLATVF